MKKLVLVLLVAMLSVPAFAADPAITLTPGGVGKVDISYTSDGTDANLPSGFGLTVTVSGTATITAVTNLDSAYTIFPGQIDINDATGVVNSYGSPIANAIDEPGTGIGTNTVVLELGALYARPAGAGKPAPNARLCTITVSANCTVTVTGNARRCGTGKGIVAQNLAAYPIDTDNTLTLPVALASQPTITVIDPTHAGAGINVAATLTGTQFAAGANVKLTKSGTDIVATGVNVVSATQITCNFPLQLTTATGAWDVVVTNTDAGTYTLAGGFTVDAAAAAPTITSILPTGGAANSTTLVSDLKGTLFVSGATVKLTKSGIDIPATNVVFVSVTKITCSLAIPAGAATGAWDVVVTNPNTRFATKVGAFTVGNCFMNGTTGSPQNVAFVKWQDYGSPSCWCFKKQCSGDADGALTGGKPVAVSDFNLFKSAYGKTKLEVKAIPGGICADFDHLDTGGRPVAVSDFNKFKEYYGDADTAVPTCPLGTVLSFWTN